MTIHVDVSYDISGLKGYHVAVDIKKKRILSLEVTSEEVFIIDRHKKELDLAPSETGKNVEDIDGDVSNLEDLDRLYATVKQQKNRIDVLRKCWHCRSCTFRINH